MKPAFKMCIVRYDRDGEIATRGQADIYRDKAEGYEELRRMIEFDDRFGIECTEVTVSDKAWKALRL
jgi:hypothetical protein